MAYQMKRGAAPKFRELGSSEAQPGDSPNKNALAGASKGALLGAKLGTVVPGVGNLAGALIGGVGGAIFGGIKANKARKEEEALLEAQKLQDAEKNQLLAKLAVERQGKEDGWRGFDGSAGGMTDTEAAKYS
jgi:phage tail tape-measure protein